MGYLNIPFHLHPLDNHCANNETGQGNIYLKLVYGLKLRLLFFDREMFLICNPFPFLMERIHLAK